MSKRDNLLGHASRSVISIENGDPSLSTPDAVDEEGTASDKPDERDYWYALINEKAAARFLDLEPRTMQGLRQRGGGPDFIRISSRCIRYRRIDLREWAEARMRSSTSDPGDFA